MLLFSEGKPLPLLDKIEKNSQGSKAIKVVSHEGIRVKRRGQNWHKEGTGASTRGFSVGVGAHKLDCESLLTRGFKT